MADFSNVVRAKHATSAAGVRDQIRFTKSGQQFEIVNLSTSDIYVRFDGTDPVVGADDTDVVRAREAVSFLLPDSEATDTVKLISSANAEYHVRRLR